MTVGAPPAIPGCEIVKLLGSGGMGQVYLAKRHGAHGFERLVAIKVIRTDGLGHQALRAMFADEARLVAQLDHPAIVQVHEFGEADGSLYLVMEYVRGLGLGALRRRGVQVDAASCLAMMAPICRGLDAAHEQRNIDDEPLNIVHRDISPTNLVLTFSGQMKILDFGIALMRARTAPPTMVGQIKGKPSYLSPEQLLGDAVDRRSDVYSAAIVLHELLTGQPLFRIDDRLQLERAVDPPSKTVAVPGGVDEIVMRGLATDPSKRFSTAKEMAEALEAVLRQEGAESVAAFADRALATARSEDERALRRVLGGIETTRPRPSTLVDAAAEAPRTTQLDLAVHTELTGAVVEPRTVAAPISSRRARWPSVLLGGAAVVVFGWLLLPGEAPKSPSPRPQTAQAQLELEPELHREPEFVPLPTTTVATPPPPTVIHGPMIELPAKRPSKKRRLRRKTKQRSVDPDIITNW